MSSARRSFCTWPTGAILPRSPRRCTSIANITRCARRVKAVGPLKAIDDLPRSGRPPDITEAARTWLIGQACVKAKDRGYPHELWTLRLLGAHAREHGPVAGHACLAELAPSPCTRC